MGDLKPHKSKYWLNPNIKDKNEFILEVKEVCNTYHYASRNIDKHVHIISTDEMTGIQALEHKYQSHPMIPGMIEKIEFEYIRHGTTTMIANFDVKTGKIIKPYLNETRNEIDFATNIKHLISTDINGEWIFVSDQLNTHLSESLVRLVAKECNFNIDLGKKGVRGILKSIKTRKEFLTDKNHRIRFVYTPKHTSWLNQIEIWFSIINRKLLNRRNSFISINDLKMQIIEFIKYYNCNCRPFKWTYKGLLLQS
jgi:transposase